jgi:lipopolysaccharide/colanic/teichoic acid biosynthesis glycosyltransferase
MLIMLFRGDAVDEARRPDCWLVIEAEMDHVGPRPELIAPRPLSGCVA